MEGMMASGTQKGEEDLRRSTGWGESIKRSDLIGQKNCSFMVCTPGEGRKRIFTFGTKGPENCSDQIRLGKRSAQGRRLKRKDSKRRRRVPEEQEKGKKLFRGGLRSKPI